MKPLLEMACLSGIQNEIQAVCHYEKKFTKNIQCPEILNKFTKFQFEEYLTNSKNYFQFIFTKGQ